jgi:hypothetical protein
MISASTVPKQLLHLVTEMGRERLETSNLSVLVLVPLNLLQKATLFSVRKIISSTQYDGIHSRQVYRNGYSIFEF